MASVMFNIKHKMSTNLLVPIWWFVSTILGDGSILPLGVLIKLI